jgi:hypothetical protein
MFTKFTKLIAIVFAISIGSFAYAQESHTIDFEPEGTGADWNWQVGENDDNPALEIVANPDPSGANTSATVAKFTARQTGNPWSLILLQVMANLLSMRTIAW